MVVDLVLTPLIAAAAAVALVVLAEALHGRRVRRVALLAFGPGRRPRAWARTAPLLRAVGAGALVWGLVTLLLVDPKKHSSDGRPELDPGDVRHVLLVLDVSPSMRLVDAGPAKELSRMERAREVMESFFRRVPLELYRISVVAVYNGAKPVVEDTSDVEVVRNILGDLPMHFAFTPGKTKLLDGLEEAAEMARPWNPGSTTLILVSDGDTVPAKGMPKMPASVGSVLIVGVGDPVSGKFIDGRQSRQDVSTLRQIATRLGGSFHNGNERHLPSALLASLTAGQGDDAFGRLTRREYALLAAALGASTLALLPLLLHALGTAWRPGRPVLRPVARGGAGASPRGRRGRAVSRHRGPRQPAAPPEPSRT